MNINSLPEYTYTVDECSLGELILTPVLTYAEKYISIQDEITPQDFVNLCLFLGADRNKDDQTYIGIAPIEEETKVDEDHMIELMQELVVIPFQGNYLSTILSLHIINRGDIEGVYTDYTEIIPEPSDDQERTTMLNEFADRYILTISRYGVDTATIENNLAIIGFTSKNFPSYFDSVIQSFEQSQVKPSIPVETEFSDVIGVRYRDLTYTGVENTYEPTLNKIKITSADGLQLFNQAQTSPEIPVIQYIDSNMTMYTRIHQGIDPTGLIRTTGLKANNIYLKIRKVNLTFDEAKIEQGQLSIKSTHESERSYRKLVEEALDVRIKKSLNKKILGYFYVDDTFEYTEASFHYFILTNPIAGRYLHIPEKNKARPEKSRVNIHYWSKSTRPGMSSDVKVTFKFDDPQGNRINIVGGKSVEVVNEFIELFCRALYVYQAQKRKIELQLRRLIPGSCPEQALIAQVRQTEAYQKRAVSIASLPPPVNYQKTKNLRDRYPQAYAQPKAPGEKAISRDFQCLRQPIIVTEEEFKYWREYTFTLRGVTYKRGECVRNVNGIDLYFVCPDNKHPIPATRPSQVEEFPFVSCGVDTSNCQGPPKGIKRSRAAGKAPREIPKLITNILQDGIKEDVGGIYHQFARITIQKGPAALVSVVERAVNEESPRNSADVIADIAATIRPEVCRQELYDEPNIKNLFSREGTMIDSRLFYRYLEEYYRLHIFVFNAMSFSQPFLEFPRYRLEYIRPRIYRECVIVLKIADPTPHYELIMYQGEGSARVTTNPVYIFGHGMTKYMFEVQSRSLQQFEVENTVALERRLNPYSVIRWTQILRKYKLVGQRIDEYGKTRLIQIEVKTNEEEVSMVTLWVPPTQPLNIKLFKTITYISRTHARELFGEPTGVTENGLTFQILDYPIGCVVFTTTNKQPDVFSPLVEEATLEDPNKLYKHQVSVLLQYIVWLWRISGLELDKFWTQYVRLPRVEEAEIKEEDIPTEAMLRQAGEIQFQVTTYKLPVVDTVEAGLEYIRWEPFFSESTIFLYPALYDRVREHLVHLDKTTTGLPPDDPLVRPAEYLERVQDDFLEQPNSLIFVGSQHLNEWIANRDPRHVEITIAIPPEFYTSPEPFVYNDLNGHDYIVQTVKRSSFNRVYNVTSTWVHDRVNLGYNAASVEMPEQTYYIIYVIRSSRLQLYSKVEGDGEALEMIKYAENRYAALLRLT